MHSLYQVKCHPYRYTKMDHIWLLLLDLIDPFSTDQDAVQCDITLHHSFLPLMLEGRLVVEIIYKTFSFELVCCEMLPITLVLVSVIRGRVGSVNTL